MLVDTHCHLDWSAFDSDRDEVIQRAFGAGVTRIVTIGVDMASSRRAIEIAEKYAGVHAAVGMHPNDCDEFNMAALNELRSLAQHPKVVAIGEIGLDYHWKKVAHDQQARAFTAQLSLAADIGKPVIIHNREATHDMMDLLADHLAHHSSRVLSVVLHSFFDSVEVAQRAVELGCLIGFTGPITFKKAEREREVVRRLPLERMLIETDAPFLTPAPHRGQRNEPAYVRHIAQMIAQVKRLSFEQVARQTTLNAEALFGWATG